MPNPQSDDPQRQLLGAIRRVIDSASGDWLSEAQVTLRHTDDLQNELLTLSAMARRRLGADPLPDTTPPIETDAGTLPIAHWSLADAGRALLLLTTCERLQPEPACWLFRHGDERERATVVRALSLLPESQRTKPLALEAGRTNSLPLFAALAQYNPYPANCYDEHEFNQLVLKALFLGIAITPMIGLQQRANHDLSRMCEAYIDERRAAGRGFPCDIWLAIAPHTTEQGRALLFQHLAASDPNHRLYAARAVAANGWRDTTTRGRLLQRLSQEPEPQVRQALQQALEALPRQS